MAITNCNKIITLGYLDDFIKSSSSSLIQDDNGEPVSVNYHGLPRTYCPTYSDLTSNSFIPYAQTIEHDYIEIGGIKWATMNIGASSITDGGLHFQWADTQGYTADQVGSEEGKKYFGWEDYKYIINAGTSSSAVTKYNSTDGKKVLDIFVDDAAQTAWGGKWRMPTTAEWEALGNATNATNTTDYQGSGIGGLVLTDKTDSSKTLFLPAAGLFNKGNIANLNSGGYYWSASLTDNIFSAYYMYFNTNSSSPTWKFPNKRYMGYSIRPVMDSSNSSNSSNSLGRDGIRINGEYEDNQNVCIEHLEVDYTRFNSLSLSASPTTFHVSGGTSTLSYDLSFNKYTKTLSGTSCNGVAIDSEEIKDTTTTVEWIQNPIIGEINYPNFVINGVESAMTAQVSGKITFRGHEETCDLPIEFHLTGTNCSCSDFMLTSTPSDYSSEETSNKYANYSAGTCITITNAVVTSYSTSANWLDVFIDSENSRIGVTPKNLNLGPSRTATVTVYYSGPNCTSSVTFTVNQAGGCSCDSIEIN